MIATGNFMNVVQYISIYLLYLYSILLEKLQCLQGETRVTFIVYSVLIELQELHFRVISGWCCCQQPLDEKTKRKVAEW